MYWSSLYNITLNLSLDTFYKFELKQDGQFYIDNVLKTTVTPRTASLGNHLFLIIYGKRQSKGMQYYRDGVLIHNCIPCYDSTDTTKHTAGFYDLETGDFYGNEGSGYFTVGPDV